MNDDEDLTILSAEFANEDFTAAVVTTKERGQIAISKEDRPVLWDKAFKEKKLKKPRAKKAAAKKRAPSKRR